MIFNIGIIELEKTELWCFAVNQELIAKSVEKVTTSEDELIEINLEIRHAI